MASLCRSNDEVEEHLEEDRGKGSNGGLQHGDGDAARASWTPSCKCGNPGKIPTKLGGSMISLCAYRYDVMRSAACQQRLLLISQTIELHTSYRFSHLQWTRTKETMDPVQQLRSGRST